MNLETITATLLTLLMLSLIHGTVLMLLTWLASATLLRRCRPSIQAALWTVVLIKFLLPPVFLGTFGLSSLLNSVRLQHEQTAVNLTQVKPAQSATATGPNEPALSREESTPPGAPQPPAPQSNNRNYLPRLLLFFYAGSLMLLAARALVYAYRTRRRIRRLPEADEALVDEVTSLAHRLGLRRVPLVRIDAETVSPYVTGGRAPTLMMPAALPEQINRAAREALIIHELAHIGRGDLLVRRMQNLTRLLFFFWPPIWWICRRLERFSEMSCDHWALRFSTASPQLYAESLLQIVKNVRAEAMSGHEVGLATAHGRLMHARFRTILEKEHDKSPHLSWHIIAVLVGWGVFVLDGSVRSQMEKPKPLTLVSSVSQNSLVNQQPTGAQPGEHFSPSQRLSATSQGTDQERRRRQAKEQERKHINENRSLMRRPTNSTETEAAAENLSANQQNLGEEPRQKAPTDNLDDDNKLSPYEIGHRDGLKEGERILNGDRKVNPYADGYRMGQKEAQRVKAQGQTPQNLDATQGNPVRDETLRHHLEEELKVPRPSAPGDRLGRDNSQSRHQH